jgi:hypothetical protein
MRFFVLPAPEEGRAPASSGHVGGRAQRAGMSAAPAMTRQKARKRPMTATAPEPIGSWKTRTPPMMAARLAATEVRAMTSTPLPICRLPAEA